MILRHLLLVVFFNLQMISNLASQQLKFYTPTVQDTYQGAAPLVSIKYGVYFKKKKNQELVIDSIKSMSDGKTLSFFIFRKINHADYTDYGGSKVLIGEKGIFRLNFNIIKLLSEEPSPAYSENDKPLPYDLSKGICIYYTLAGKNKAHIIRDFKVLPAIHLP